MEMWALYDWIFEGKLLGEEKTFKRVKFYFNIK
jgi:hypothetical protein